MRPNELRIGNHVYCEDKIIQLRSRDIYHFDKSGLKLDPIPLTKQLLSDFGFKYYEKEEAWQNQFLHIEDRNDDKPLLRNHKDLRNCFGVWSNHYNGFIRDIKYVHQLENICFELTENELILNKEYENN